ncbi:GNAT family N-acetyltransferase [Robertmurraya korlensis]|uniref:GNAT family N-acetyltransferase n=1 Tax=Robertmurraya korlensis TaxID=519977 RepID=UPI000824C5F4|nr:GNAT family N-acetyltransferase [Robertmurraya korlensis]
MENGNIQYRKMRESDSTLINYFTQFDTLWRSLEMNQLTTKEYIQKYNEGEWRIWEQDESDVAITYHLENAPSNTKPWIGTIIVQPNERRQGLGIRVVQQLKEELQEKGHKAIFAGVPVDAHIWIQFLSDCYFEQFKIEKDEQNQMFLIMVSPL